MHQILLHIHSYWRWLVLVAILIIVIKSIIGYKSDSIYNSKDGILRKIVISILHIQFILGSIIYSFSPLVKTFFKNISENIHEREIRFFAIEHSLMMLVAIVIVTIGAVKVKKQSDSKLKYQTTYVWFGIALIIILLNIPWEFSPLVNRPSFR